MKITKNLIFDVVSSIVILGVFIAGCVYLPKTSLGGYGYGVAALAFFIMLFVVGWIEKRFVK